MDNRKTLLVKSLRKLLINHSLSQSKRQAQATDIQEEEVRMSINLPYVENTSEKLRRTVKSQSAYIKTHYGEAILRYRKLEKTGIKYSSYTNHSRCSLRFRHSKILPKDLPLKSRTKTERSKTIFCCCKSRYISICYT